MKQDAQPKKRMTALLSWFRTSKKQDTTNVTRRIVCAATKLNDGTLVLGVRHSDALMQAIFQRLKINPSDLGLRSTTQGFIDNHGIWMNRKEAWKVAEAAGQIIRRVGADKLDGGTLFSENLF